MIHGAGWQAGGRLARWVGRCVFEPFRVPRDTQLWYLNNMRVLMILPSGLALQRGNYSGARA